MEEILTNYCGYCECRSFEFSNRSNRVLFPEIKKVFLFFELLRSVKTWNLEQGQKFGLLCLKKKYCKALSQHEKNLQSNRVRGVNNDFNFLPKGEKTDEFRTVLHKK